MDSVHILGLRVHRTTMDEALQALDEYVRQRTPARQVVTADSSMAVIARRDPELHAIIEAADLVTPDSEGILWASELLGTPITRKVSGVDLVERLCQLSAEKGYRLFFLGAAPGVADEAAANLQTVYPGAQVVGTRDGYFRPEEEADVLAGIKAACPDVLLVAFGIPKQEKWIARHKEELGVPVSIGIGGSFDVYSGRVKRAPLRWRAHRLEWLYRVLSNPKKIGKVMTLPQFAFLALRQRFLGAS